MIFMPVLPYLDHLEFEDVGFQEGKLEYPLEMDKNQ